MGNLDLLHKINPKLLLSNQMVLDFGPPLEYEEVCRAYTVEKLTLWQTGEDMVALRGKGEWMPRARLEGRLYYIPDDTMIAMLDFERSNGVYCERKYLPILLPYQDNNGEFLKSYAYIYLGDKNYWQDRIETELLSRRNGNYIVRPGEFTLAPQVPDAERLLNNRRAFDVPPYVREEYPVSPLMAMHCKERNAAEIARLDGHRRDQLLRDQAQREKERQLTWKNSRMGRVLNWMKE